MDIRELVVIFMLVCVSTPLLLGARITLGHTLESSLGSQNFDVYLINLDRDPGRLNAFKHVFGQCDLSKNRGLIRHRAIDGTTLDIKSLVTPKARGEIMKAERLQYRSKHYELTRGAVGCWLSHVALWTQFAETDKNVALIFEDDCVMVTDLEQQMKSIYPPNDWDIILLGYVCTACDNHEGSDMIRVDRFFGLHCYVISRRFVKKFMTMYGTRKIGKQIDSVLSDMIRNGDIKVYASRKKLAWQNNRHGTRIQMPIRAVPGVDVWSME